MLKEIFSTICSVLIGSSSLCPVVPVIADETFYYSSSYNGYGANATTTHVEINYDSYTLDDTHCDILFPIYTSAYGTNACAPTAGCMLVAYYDYYYPNLMPNSENGTMTSDGYEFDFMSEDNIDVMIELYDLMGTNTQGAGTSSAQFRSGMTSFFSNHGYGLTFSSLSFSPFSATNVINRLNQEKPIVLFLSGYQYYPEGGIWIYSDRMTMIQYTETVGHVVVAFGYQKYRYYTNGSNFRTDEYLVVAFGNETYGLLAIDGVTNIVEAYTLNITTT